MSWGRGPDAHGLGDVEQRLFDEPRHHAGVGPAGAHRRRAARPPAPQVHQRFAQGVVRALRHGKPRVGVEARPGLDHRVDVEGADVLAEIDDRHRRGIDRQVDDEALPAAVREQRLQDVAEVLACEPEMLEPDAALVEQRPVVVVGRDDGELRLVEADVAFEQRQGAPADRAEADHHDGAVETGVDRSIGHRARPCAVQDQAAIDRREPSRSRVAASGRDQRAATAPARASPRQGCRARALDHTRFAPHALLDAPASRAGVDRSLGIPLDRQQALQLAHPSNRAHRPDASKVVGDSPWDAGTGRRGAKLSRVEVSPCLGSTAP